MSNTVIKTVVDTFLKINRNNASELTEDEKVMIPKNSTLELTDISGLDSSHYEITLKSAIDNYNSLKGYVFAPHWGIVSSDDPDLKKEVAIKPKSPAVQRQIERITKYLPEGKELNLDVKTTFFSQRDNYTMPHRTCNSSSNAMYLDWLLRVIGKSGLKTDDEYLRKLLVKGDTIYHDAQTKTIKDYGFSTKWNTDADLAFVEDLLETGFPVVVNILHRGSEKAPRGGHIIMLIGNSPTQFTAHDPYGTLASDYKNTNGAFSKIDHDEFKVRWQGGYRILA